MRRLEAEIKETLKKYWGFDGFLPLQEEAIECVLGGRDSIVVLPTGGGKSLCYQAPAVISAGLTLVVSPLLSLMKDQVDSLIQCGIHAARFDSSQSPGERDTVFDRIKDKSLKLLYVSPERIFSEGFIDFLRNTELSAIAIDESHCISHWGHDFRPEYRALGDLKTAMPYIHLHAYTATATARVRQDIARQLRLEEPQILVGSFDRPNLKYKVESRSEGFKQVCDIIDRHQDESGIVYCIRRKDVDALTIQLEEAGFRVAPYHAGLEHEERIRNQDRFLSEEVDIIVATVAFGMGIDKSNVRYVVHSGMPKSLEHYQQESGRAGRDGLEAECVILYSGGDYGSWKAVFGKEGSEGQEIALDKLDDIYSYCTGVTCRHRALLRYFGQDLENPNCQACDVCLGDLHTEPDSLVIAQKILSCVVRLKERFGGQYTAQVLVGSSVKRILQFHHDKISTYGALSSHKEKIVHDWIEQLVGQGCLAKEDEYNTLAVTFEGRRVLKGERTPTLLKPVEQVSKASRAALDSWEGVDRGLFEALRSLRRKISQDRSVPAFVVFSDASLRDMARKRPSDPERFLSVHGVGEAKSKEFGETFLKKIERYCKENDLQTNVGAEKVSIPSNSKAVSDAKGRAFKLFEDRRSIKEVAEKLDRALSTTNQYLVAFLGREGKTDPTPWVSPVNYRRVYDVLLETDTERLTPLFEKLNEEVPYEEIRIVRICVGNGGRPEDLNASVPDSRERSQQNVAPATAAIGPSTRP